MTVWLMTSLVVCDVTDDDVAGGGGILMVVADLASVSVVVDAGE